jgi:hypothetical protein
MSKLIDDVLNVLQLMRNQYGGERGSARRLRISAVKQVAAKRNVGRNDIEDALRRRLSLKSVPGDFDPLTERWLIGDSAKLLEVLEQAALDDDDLRAIREFLGQPVVAHPAPSDGEGSEGQPGFSTKPKTKRSARTSRRIVVVVLDADVGEAFPTAKAVNNTLRSLIKILGKVPRRATK